MFDSLGPPELWWMQFRAGFGPQAEFVLRYHQVDPYWPFVILGAFSWFALPILFVTATLWLLFQNPKELKELT